MKDFELAKLYQNCNLYVTCDRYLFFGLPIAEAANFKKPTVALNFAAAKELIETGKTGVVVKSGEEMKKTLKYLINNPEVVEKMGRSAFVKVKKEFSWEKIALEYDEFLRQIVG